MLLAALLTSQVPVLVFPRLWNLLPTRIFLLKLPAWLADIGSAAVIRACSSDSRLGNAWALRYLLDPIVIFVTVFHGQSDAIANVCAVIGIAAMLFERYELAALAIGLGVGAKFYPAAFAPLLIVAAVRRDSRARALRTAGIFAAVAAATLLPVIVGRSQSVVGSWINNSFGPQGDRVASASLWGLLPPQYAAAGLSPQIEQIVAVAIPLLLAALELRHVPDRRDLARAAMLSAMAAVLLNPGAHPPFYLWIAGPLVLYAAVTGNGVVSTFGVVLSCLGVFMQLCQEPGGEYVRFVFGSVTEPGALRCLSPFVVLQSLALISAAAIVFAAYQDRSFSQVAMRSWRRIGQWAAPAFCLTFALAVVAEARTALASHANPVAAFREEERHVNTFAIFPLVQDRRDGSCLLTYDAADLVVYAGNPYAARFGSAFLRYSEFVPAELIVRGHTVALRTLDSRLVRAQVFIKGSAPFRTEREFDVSAELRPYAYVERILERPCNRTPGNPVLIYRFDIPAAHAVAQTTPILERIAAMRAVLF